MGAVHGTHIGGLDGHHPRVELVDQAGRGVVGGHRRNLDAGVVDHLPGGYRLQHDRVVDHPGHDQAGIVGGESHTIGLGNAGHRFQLGSGQIDESRQSLHRIDGVADLAGKGVPGGLVHAELGHDPRFIGQHLLPELDAAGGGTILFRQILLYPPVGGGGNRQGSGEAAAHRDHMLIDLLVTDGQGFEVDKAQSEITGDRLPAAMQLEQTGKQGNDWPGQQLVPSAGAGGGDLRPQGLSGTGGNGQRSRQLGQEVGGKSVQGRVLLQSVNRGSIHF